MINILFSFIFKSCDSHLAVVLVDCDFLADELKLTSIKKMKKNSLKTKLVHWYLFLKTIRNI
jgi:hypothetical protein